MRLAKVATLVALLGLVARCELRVDVSARRGDAGTGDIAISFDGQSDSARETGSAETRGTGGMPGTAGSSGSGGVPGNGGSSGSGGVPGNGGASGSGGMPGNGGASGSGGVQANGGSAGAGGQICFVQPVAVDPAGTAPSAGCSTATYAGHSYVFCPAEMTAAQARLDCAARGMTLIMVNNTGENAWVHYQAMALPGSADHNLLLGGSDALVEGQWRWQDGWQFSNGADSACGNYANWHSGYPANASPASDNVLMYLKAAASDWIDGADTEVSFFGCESG